MPITKTDFVKKYKTKKVESVDDDNDISDAQKLANWMAELGTCVYNKMKKAEIKVGLSQMIIDGSGKRVDERDVPEYLDTPHTISEMEKYLNKNIETTAGHIFIFGVHYDEITDIFNGGENYMVELRYEEDDNEKFVPLVCLGMAPIAKSVKKVTAKKATKQDKEIDDFIATIKPRSFYENMTIKELKSTLEQHGLPTSGTKDRLIYKLQPVDNTFEPSFCTDDYCPLLAIELREKNYHIYNREKGRTEDFSWKVVQTKDQLRDHIIKWYNEHKERHRKTTKPSDGFIRDKTEHAKVWDLQKFDISKAKFGDLAVDMKDALEMQRGMASEVVDIKPDGRLYLREAYDDSGYTDAPIEVTQRIEDPIEFYKYVPKFLAQPWGIVGVMLDKKVHKTWDGTENKDGTVWFEYEQY